MEARDYNVWWDKDLLASQDYASMIEDALNPTQSIVTVWSSNSVKSKWVRAESSNGFNQNKILPILIEDANIPIPYDSVHTADLRTWEGDEQDPAFLGLINALDWILKREKTEPAPVPLAAVSMPNKRKEAPVSSTEKSSKWPLLLGGLAIAVAAGTFLATNGSDTPTVPPVALPEFKPTVAEALAIKKCEEANGGKSIVQAAGSEKGDYSRMEECIKLKVNTNLTDSNGWTALHAAANRGHETIARLLVSNETARDAKDKNGRTPLSLAVIKNHHQMVDYLLSIGASVNIPEKEGAKPLSRAKQGSTMREKLLPHK